jgi:hypothetical protein
MLRSYEIALIAAPLIGALLWWRLSHVRLAVAIATVVVVAVLGALVISYGLERHLGPGQYVPARLEDGRIVEGHGAGNPPGTVLPDTRPAATAGPADP